MSEREHAHWIGLASLVANDQRRRVLTLAENAKKRRKLVSMFHHNIKFDPAFALAVGKKGTESEVLDTLRKCKAGDEALALNLENDCNGEWKPTEDAVSDCFGRCSGTVISIIPGSLVYYEADEPESRAVIFKSCGANSV